MEEHCPPEPVPATAAEAAARESSSAVDPAEDLSPRSPHLLTFGLDRLGLMRAVYASYFSGFIIVGAFASLLYESKGFSPAAVGWLGSLPPVCVVAVVPGVCYVAETRQWQERFMLGALGIAAVLLTVIVGVTDQVVIVGCAILLNVALAPTGPLLDEHVLAVIGKARKDTWGQYRCYGAYGWAICAVVVSLIFGYLGWGYALVILYLGFAGAAWCVYQTPPKGKVVGDHGMVDVLKSVWHRPRVLTWVAGCSYMGLGYALIGTFLFLFLKDLGAPPILFGLCVVATVVVEVPLFRSSAALYARFSNRQLLLMAMAGFITRVVGYSLLQSPWPVLLLEPLHGFTFGLMWLSGIKFFSDSFPPQLANSAVGLLHTSAFGVGPIIGNIIGGYLYDGLGPRWMFRLGAASMVLVAAAFYVADRHFEAAEVAAAAAAAPQQQEADAAAAKQVVKEEEVSQDKAGAAVGVVVEEATPAKQQQQPSCEAPRHPTSAIDEVPQADGAVPPAS